MPKNRFHIIVKGVVQGVGFRPFIYQLAHSHKLTGWVLNSSKGVIIEVEGEKKDLEAFVEDIGTKAPPLAKIESIDVEFLPPMGYSSFIIKHSVEEQEQFLLISPDICICHDCLRELFDPNDRRYRYPFINCTNCGPRFTIIEDIPYDRPKTTMKKFKMCPKCQAEYDDPANRRFHAQPNACPRCGPSLQLAMSRESPGRPYGSSEAPVRAGVGSVIRCEDSITETIKLLKEGKIVAIKGLGGFHLACDAENDKAVETLRVRKRRPGKPLAIMLHDVKQIKKHCFVSEDGEKILKSPQRPIVLLLKKPETSISPLVAPNNNYLGVMLPYTPLHYILLKESGMALIMTSGNISEEPIAMENEEALRRLGHIADYFLMHNRDIYSRYDDSVVRVIDGELIMIRRARSFAPFPIRLPFKVKEILACGPELKNTFCLTHENYAFLSQHIGDMENLETFEHFETTLELYKRLFRINPKIVVYDLHPEYLSTKYALSLKGVKLVGVQHHHAHIVSCMVENEVKDKVIGISFDGLGYGTDGTIWGGEILIADWKGFERVGHLRYVPMPGGAAAIEKPYRMAFGFLYSFFGENYRDLKIDFLKFLDETEVNIMKRQIDKKINSPLTSSCGRLFDAVSSLTRIKDEIDYEGQAAVELEMVADPSIEESYPFEIQAKDEGRRTRGEYRLVIDTKPIIEGVVRDLENGVSVSIIAAKFHNTVMEFVLDICKRIRERKALNKVVLSGGVFQNVYLLTNLPRRLEREGFEVFIQKKVPANDGGISLGQVVVANEICKDENSIQGIGEKDVTEG